MVWVEVIGSGLASLLLVFLCVTSGILKEQKVLNSAYGWLHQRLKSKRLTIFILSMFSGILPIHGRVMVAAPLLDPLVIPGTKSPKLSVISYLATHHYYLWSPLEKAILISMAGLSLSYPQVVLALWPFLALMLLFTLVYLIFFVKEEDLHTQPAEELDRSKLSDLFILVVGIGISIYGIPIYVTFIIWALYLMIKYDVGFKKAIGYTDWKLVALVAISVMIGTLTRNYSKEITDYANGLVTQGSHPTLLVLGVSFLFGLVLGSSAKYAGLAVVGCSLTGNQHLAEFYITGFCGYLLSPAHQCLPIARAHFGASRVYFYGIMGLLVVVLLSLLLLMRVAGAS